MLGMCNSYGNQMAAEFVRQQAAKGRHVTPLEKPTKRNSSSTRNSSASKSLRNSMEDHSSSSISSLHNSVNWTDSGKRAEAAKEIEKIIEEHVAKIASTSESIERTGTFAKVRLDAGNKVGALLSIKQKKRLEMDKLRVEGSLKDLEVLLGEVELSDEVVPYKYKMKQILDLGNSESSMQMPEDDELLAEIAQLPAKVASSD